MTLWTPYDIPIVCLAGECSSGKTLWGLTVSPTTLDFSSANDTLVWDTEQSSLPYVSAMNFTRVDLPQRAQNTVGPQYTNMDMFEAWEKDLVCMPKKKYRVLMLDTVSSIEDGITQYVSKNPSKFGYTHNQFAKMEGLKWGVIKSEWERLLLIAKERCETLVLTVHMRDEFAGKTRTGRRVPKGKATIMEITSLYITLYRTVVPGSKKVQTKPSGICRKSRLVHVNSETKELEQIFPPHIADATPDGIREYLKNPPNFNSLKVSERARPTRLFTDDEKLTVRAGIAADEATRAQADLIKEEMQVSKSTALTVPTEIGEVKVALLEKFTVPKAIQLLKTRYHVDKLAKLTSTQLSDLKEHLETLKN